MQHFTSILILFCFSNAYAQDVCDRVEVYVDHKLDPSEYELELIRLSPDSVNGAEEASRFNLIYNNEVYQFDIYSDELISSQHNYQIILPRFCGASGTTVMLSYWDEANEQYSFIEIWRSEKCEEEAYSWPNRLVITVYQRPPEDRD